MTVDAELQRLRQQVAELTEANAKLTSELRASTIGAAEALRARELVSREIVDNIPIHISLMSPTGQVELINQQILDYTGKTREELMSWGMSDLVHPDDLERAIECNRNGLCSGCPFEIVYRMRRRDGEYRWFEARHRPQKDVEGRVIRWCVSVDDIDERKRATDALRQSEFYALQLVHSIPAMIAVFSPTGEVEHVNQQVLDFYGKTEEDLKNWASGGTVHPEDLPRAVEIFSRSVATGEPFEMEVRARRFDGVFRCIESRGLPFRDGNGTVVRWYNLLIDVDDRTRAEAEFAAESARLYAEVDRARDQLRQTLDMIPALAWSSSTDGSASFANQRWIEYTGQTFAEVVGRGWEHVFHPDDMPAVAGALSSMAEGKPFEFEARMRHVDGVYRWFLSRAEPLHGLNGDILEWFGTNIDIDERKRAEAELEWRARLAEIAAGLASTPLEQLDDAIDAALERAGTLFGLDVISTVRITKQGSTISGAYRWTRPGTLPAVPPIASVELALRIGGESIGALEFTWFRSEPPAGEHIAGRLHQIADLFAGAIARQHAAYELARSAAALDHAQSELARVARVSTLGVLAASIVHEVNQALSGIVTNAATCRRMLAASPPNIEGALQTAERMMRDANRAADVIARLPALLIKKGSTTEVVDLNESTQEVIALTHKELQRNRVVVETELCQDLPAVSGDRAQLQQVILNLMMNASDAMSGVEERPRHLLIKTEAEAGARVRLSVQDAGVGFDPVLADQLFDAFYTSKSSGMGIGLSISRHIIKNHDGTLSAALSDGPGATFAFSIPRAC